ncbi:MraY family glycosyltransferase [Geomesophilobacter sediminis]|uniref:Undecaprenyl/decaprenyl-phosphate alpha-N-acetylglucosaminyl 1-phosphate transferase n=1 Tax=Geomesophilobacter sediminis TaxID=2798584 RepID=A0A8J7LU53_9BACT|nr:MraY family glycosyltransferase [Geomesophilobacter sediminis]MBJ6724244.1 undecaprenyl/decaprenyl-phosphate alpha-N-acetylglucosaminyl 1-phosphate transferase [Geomesophilobacter sediminis]
MTYLTTLLTAVLVTIALTPLFIELALRLQWVDLPNERKVHTIPIPRVGGGAMALGAFLPLCYWLPADRFVLSYLAGAAVLVLVGGVDDVKDLSPKVKFAGQGVAALVAIFGGGVRIVSLGGILPDTILPGWVSISLTLFAIVGVTNAINLSDGLDGLAGGISLLIFAGIGYLAFLDGNTVIGLIALALLGALFGFLRFNTHPASVFMGDAGSQLLGFSAVILALALTQGHQTALSPVLPLILLGFPVLDTLTVMTLRVSRGRSPFAADKNHFHHNLMALGFRHPESVLIIYLFQTVLLVAAVHFRFYPDWMLLAGYLLFSALILAGFWGAARRGRPLRRVDLFNAHVAGRLRLLKREGSVIRRAFRPFEAAVLLLLVGTAFLADRPPLWVSALFLVGAAAILLALWRRWAVLPGLLRMVLYLLIPFAVYLGHPGFADAFPALARCYDASFGAVAVLMILVSKFSRRTSGFRSSPMDFLILILAVVVPNLPEQAIQEHRVGLIAAKILLLYFCFEVLQAELRGRYGRLALSTAAALLLVAL